MRNSVGTALGVLAVALGSGCGAPTGAVELAWVFVDRGGDPIYPGGVFSLDDERDSCGLPGIIRDQSLRYDLRIDLEICDPECTAGCEAEECLVLPRQRFACTTARGNEPEVPASDQPYRFTLRPVVNVPSLGLECPDPAPTCLAVPSPRERIVEAGHVIDLQVYQIAVDVDRSGGAPLDLEACGCA